MQPGSGQFRPSVGQSDVLLDWTVRSRRRAASSMSNPTRYSSSRCRAGFVLCHPRVDLSGQWLHQTLAALFLSRSALNRSISFTIVFTSTKKLMFHPAFVRLLLAEISWNENFRLIGRSVAFLCRVVAFACPFTSYSSQFNDNDDNHQTLQTGRHRHNEELSKFWKSSASGHRTFPTDSPTVRDTALTNTFAYISVDMLGQRLIDRQTIIDQAIDWWWFRLRQYVIQTP